MEFKNKVEYAIEDWHKYEDDEDISIAIARVTFLSDKPNSHHHVYTKEVIQKYAESYLGKFVVAEYNELYNDVTTHTNRQKIVGVIPQNGKIYYETRDDGYFYASTDVAISKIYAPEVYALFKENNYRSVSVEELVGFAEGEENIKDGTMDKHIVGFEGIGITILGKNVKPSIEGMNIQVTRMSEDSINSIEEEYVKYSQKSSNVEPISMCDIMAKLENIEKKLDKEEIMPNTENEALVTEDVVEMSEVENKAEEEMSEIDEKAEVVENAEDEEMSEEVENAEEPVVDEKAEVEEMANDTEVENACAESEDTKEEAEMQEQKCAELETKLADAEQKLAMYEAELSELREFKHNIQKSEKEAIINATLSQIKSYCDSEKYEEFAKQGEICEYANINGWRNEVLASISDKLMAKMSELTSKENGVLDMGMPVVTETKKESIYD